jgi:hypothetical protein
MVNVREATFLSQSVLAEPGERGDMKDRQASKIKELADTLVSVGFVSLDQQAVALGLPRSTTWTILAGKHKNYGISAALIKRLLDKHDLNSRIRDKIIEYVREKAAGSYGHNQNQLRRFMRQLVRLDGSLPHDVLFTYRGARRNARTPRDGRKASPVEI